MTDYLQESESTSQMLLRSMRDNLLRHGSDMAALDELRDRPCFSIDPEPVDDIDWLLQCHQHGGSIPDGLTFEELHYASGLEDRSAESLRRALEATRTKKLIWYSFQEREVDGVIRYRYVRGERA